MKILESDHDDDEDYDDYVLKWKGKYDDLHASIKGKYVIKQHASSKTQIKRKAKCKTTGCLASVLLITKKVRDKVKEEEEKEDERTLNI